MAMAAVICFGLMLPRALATGHRDMAYGIAAIFVAYVAVNVVIWRRMRS